MEISNAAAQQIVEEIGKLVRHNINMMDEKGIIIASKDENRIGQFHEVAYRIINEGLQELYVPKEDELENVRCGLNLPINLDNKIVGVIGITGPYESVHDYGLLIKKMTEILVKEESLKREQQIDKHIKNNFFEEWILGKNLISEIALYERGISLGIDITKDRTVMIISVENISKFVDNSEGQHIIRNVEQFVTKLIKRNVINECFRNSARVIALVKKDNLENILDFANEIIIKVKKQLDIDIVIGIADISNDNIQSAYIQANKAWRYAVERKKQIVCYENLYAEVLLDEVSFARKKEFLKKVFKECDYNQIRELIEALEIYFKCEGSVKDASEMMYIHKNTYQYRLKKVYQKTGLDVRRPSNEMVLNLATLIFREIEDRLE